MPVAVKCVVLCGVGIGAPTTQSGCEVYCGLLCAPLSSSCSLVRDGAHSTSIKEVAGGCSGGSRWWVLPCLGAVMYARKRPVQSPDIVGVHLVGDQPLWGGYRGSIYAHPFSRHQGSVACWLCAVLQCILQPRLWQAVLALLFVCLCVCLVVFICVVARMGGSSYSLSSARYTVRCVAHNAHSVLHALCAYWAMWSLTGQTALQLLTAWSCRAVALLPACHAGSQASLGASLV